MGTPQLVRAPGIEALTEFSLVENDAPLRWQRTLHIAPASGLGVARRAITLAVLCWTPIAVWAIARGRLLDAAIGEPLLQHYGVHVRCLLAIPLLILGESTLDRAARLYMPSFVRSGLIDPAMQPRFEATLRTMRRWRNATLPWLFIGGAAVAWGVIARRNVSGDEMSWALNQHGGLGFGGLWFAYVVRPIFIGMLLGWLWRVALLAMLFVRMGRLGLSLVPSHPDGSGGLGFLERLPAAFAPVTFAVSATLASRWAHLIVYHAQTLNALKGPAGIFIVLWTAILLAPLMTFVPVLHRAKQSALPGYAALVAEQGRAVRRRWIDAATRSESSALEPKGVGPIADAAQLFAAVRSMRNVPISKASFAGILVPLAIPLLFVAALQMPLRQLVVDLAKALI